MTWGRCGSLRLHRNGLAPSTFRRSPGAPRPQHQEPTCARAALTKLKEAIAAADGLLLATPEYNNSIPGVFKNAIDWLSRPPADIQRIFGGKLVALIGASPGNFGTVLSQNAWLPVLRTLGAELWSEGRLLVPRAHGVFDEAGTLTDTAVKERLDDFLRRFVAIVGMPKH